VNRYQLLYATPDLSVSRFDHPPHEAHEDPEEEVGTRWAIAFVQSGCFQIVVAGDRLRLRRGSVLLMWPGLEFRCEHDESCPTDVCLSIGFDSAAVADVEHLWERAAWAARASATPRLAYVDHRMRTATAHDDRFEMERWAIAALSALDADTRPTAVRGRYAARRSDVDAVASVCRDIEASPESRRSVANRAREVGLTGSQLTRCFRRYIGASPHEYAVRWRLAAAAGLLDSGLNVSASCYASGFEQLSHFCRTFQRTFGVRASKWHTLALRERRRKVHDLTHRLR
jgi:methylphosphotriester-DNA--protein-cysteine methyltransferase